MSDTINVRRDLSREPPFGRLKAIRPTRQTARRMTIWLCQCECGNEVEVHSSALTSGNTASCGCLREKHGHAKSGADRHGTYSSWEHMHQRCSNPNYEYFDDYGGRGIRVCERWASFETFLGDMGERPAGTTLDRKEVDGNYEPGNCRWATIDEQNNNTRRSRRLTYGGRTQSYSEWSRQSGIPRHIIANRARDGWDSDRIFSTPFRQHKRRAS